MNKFSVDSKILHFLALRRLKEHAVLILAWDYRARFLKKAKVKKPEA